jgi:hypothetical protein
MISFAGGALGSPRRVYLFTFPTCRPKIRHPDVVTIGRLLFPGDKPGKDTNFRGLTIFDNTLYVSKCSGGNGVNSVYQAGTAGVLPGGTTRDGTAYIPARVPHIRR